MKRKSQYNRFQFPSNKINRKVKLQVYCEIINLDEFKKIKSFNGIMGIILSGGPSTVTKKACQKFLKVYLRKNPILGIYMDYN